MLPPVYETVLSPHPMRAAPSLARHHLQSLENGPQGKHTATQQLPLPAASAQRTRGRKHAVTETPPRTTAQPQQKPPVGQQPLLDIILTSRPRVKRKMTTRCLGAPCSAVLSSSRTAFVPATTLRLPIPRAREHLPEARR